MTTTSRPSLARKHTRKTDEKRKSELDSGVRISITGDDGESEVFEVRVGDITPALAAEVRKATGMSFRLLMETLATDPDVDVLTAFEWLARRIRGEEVDLSDVEFSYADIDGEGFDIAEVGPREEPDPTDPE